jgi:peptidase E
MTKYILHGGYTNVKNKFNEKFFKEILSDFKTSAKILLVLFAREQKEWLMLEKREKDHLTKSRPDLKLEFEIANEKGDILERQIKHADVVFIVGGQNDPLKKILRRVGNLRYLFENKTVAGSSAGAYVLSKYFYSHEDKGIFRGLGVLPIKVLAHYTARFNKKLEELKNYKEKLKTYALPDTKYAVINI